MSDSDLSDYSNYQSDEEIRCILQSSSSSDEETETCEHPPDSGFGIGTDVSNPSIGKQYPLIFEHLKTIYTAVDSEMLPSTSLMKDWGAVGRLPNVVLFDVCVLSPIKLVTLLTVSKEHSEDDEHVVKYNTKVARHLVTLVREHLFPIFSVVSGVLDLSLCRNKDILKCEIERLEAEAQVCSVPESLQMTSLRYKYIKTFIDKLSTGSSDSVLIKEKATSDSSASRPVDKDDETVNLKEMKTDISNLKESVNELWKAIKSAQRISDNTEFPITGKNESDLRVVTSDVSDTLPQDGKRNGEESAETDRSETEIFLQTIIRDSDDDSENNLTDHQKSRRRTDPGFKRKGDRRFNSLS